MNQDIYIYSPLPWTSLPPHSPNPTHLVITEHRAELPLLQLLTRKNVDVLVFLDYIVRGWYERIHPNISARLILPFLRLFILRR